MIFKTLEILINRMLHQLEIMSCYNEKFTRRSYIWLFIKESPEIKKEK